MKTLAFSTLLSTPDNAIWFLAASRPTAVAFAFLSVILEGDLLFLLAVEHGFVGGI
jgi:hypothetical protein